MQNLFNRTFEIQQEEPKANYEHINNALNAENIVTFEAVEQERNRAILEEKRLDKRIDDEIERATNEENNIYDIIRYKTIKLNNIEHIPTNHYCRYIIIRKNGNEEKTVLCPIFELNNMYSEYTISFVYNNYPYFIKLDNSGDNQHMKPEYIQIPNFDNNEYSVNIITSKLPWVL